MDRREDSAAFAEALQASANVYGRDKLTVGTIELYWRVLERYPIGDVLTALSRHLADPDVGQYMPKPADVVRQIDGSTDTQAMQAWARVMRATRNPGTYATVVFDDWRIHAALSDMGGWVKAGEWAVDELPYRSAEFEKRYRGYLRMDRAPYPARLVGRAERDLPASYEPDPPVLIGDARLAEMTFEGGTAPAGLITRTLGTALRALGYGG